MLYLKKQNLLPSPTDEGATGRFDNKGAIFIPGGFVIEDSDKRLLKDTHKNQMTNEYFTQHINQALNFDNATLIYPNGIQYGINLPNGFFIEKSSKILAIKDSLLKRGNGKPKKYFSDNITTQLTPNYFLPPFGTRTKISSCVSVCVNNPKLYFLECVDNFGARVLEQEGVWQSIVNSQKKVLSQQGDILYNPNIVVMHDTRYTQNNLVGIIRFLSIGKAGDFATLTFETPSTKLYDEVKQKSLNKCLVKLGFGQKVAVVFRVYSGNKVTTKLVCLNTLGIKNIEISQIVNDAISYYSNKLA